MHRQVRGGQDWRGQDWRGEVRRGQDWGRWWEQDWGRWWASATVASDTSRVTAPESGCGQIPQPTPRHCSDPHTTAIFVIPRRGSPAKNLFGG